MKTKETMPAGVRYVSGLFLKPAMGCQPFALLPLLRKPGESANILNMLEGEAHMNSDSNLSNRTLDGKTIVDVDAQNVDFRNCEAIKTTVSGLVAQGQAHVLLNLSKVSFMDSSGLGVILFCKRACDEAGGTFGVFGLQNYVSNLVNLTNLNKTISIYASEADALV